MRKKKSRKKRRMVVVSNRLPVVIDRVDGRWDVKPGSGGLVTALTPVLQERGGLWIGWPGTAETEGLEAALDEAAGQTGYALKPVALDDDLVQGFYYGFANEVAWPLFHGFETICNFDPDNWAHYEEANRRFAAAVDRHREPGDFIWIHDYHLMLTARELRARGADQRMAFFLHIPFPSPEVFFKMPWRAQILEGLLAFDLLGFQTMRDRRNFTACLRQLRLEGLKIRGRGSVVDVRWRDRRLRAGAFPISIDYRGIVDGADSEEVRQEAWLFHERLPDRQVIIGIDRLDYTKGIPERLEAMRRVLEQRPDLHEKITLVQVTVPSREQVPEYEHLRQEIERLVGEINGEHTEPGWVPIQYLHRSLSRTEVYAWLRASEIALVTPLRDGMNLVAKEFCACDIDRKGVLILSEFAGAAAELDRGALLVNPYDVEGLAQAIIEAYEMPAAERRKRMDRMRSRIRRHDIFRWVDSVLEAAAARGVEGAPKVHDLRPQVELQP